MPNHAPPMQIIMNGGPQKGLSPVYPSCFSLNHAATHKRTPPAADPTSIRA